MIFRDMNCRYLAETISRRDADAEPPWMARMEPGTATCEIFICVGDQPSLDYGGMRNSDGQGFAAFGKVIEGMDVVRKIQQSPADGQWLKPRIKINKVVLQR